MSGKEIGILPLNGVKNLIKNKEPFTVEYVRVGENLRGIPLYHAFTDCRSGYAR